MIQVIILVFLNTCTVAVEHYNQPEWLTECLCEYRFDIISYHQHHISSKQTLWIHSTCLKINSLPVFHPSFFNSLSTVECSERVLSHDITQDNFHQIHHCWQQFLLRLKSRTDRYFESFSDLSYYFWKSETVIFENCIHKENRIFQLSS